MGVVFFLLSFSCYGVGLEQGESTSFKDNPKYLTSNKYTAITLRKGHVEAILGGWKGGSYGRFIGLSGAYRSSGKWYFDGSLGVVHLIDYRGNQLDGENQFTLTLGAGRRFGNLNAGIKVRHFSNGSRFLNGDNSKNRGMDFKLFNLEYLF